MAYPPCCYAISESGDPNSYSYYHYYYDFSCLPCLGSKRQACKKETANPHNKPAIMRLLPRFISDSCRLCNLKILFK